MAICTPSIIPASLCSLSVALACTSGQRPPPLVPARKSEITLIVPDSIDGFRLAERQAFDDPLLGYRLRYSGPDSMYTDVYVYPGPILGVPCDSATAIAAVEAQVVGFRESFPTMIERHYVDSIAIDHDEPLVAVSAVRWCVGRHLTLGVLRDGRPERSEFYLYALSGYFVKLRITYPFTSSRLALVGDFVSALFTRLLPNN